MKGNGIMNDQNTNSAQEATAEATPLKLDVNVRPIEPKNNLLAFASVKIADCFVVNGIKVVAGEKGFFVDMPSVPDRKTEGKFHDVCFPVTADFRQQLNSAVLDGYSAALEKMQTIGEAHRGEVQHADGEAGRQSAAKRPPMQDQIRNAAKAAAEHNAAAPQRSAAPSRAGAEI